MLLNVLFIFILAGFFIVGLAWVISTRIITWPREIFPEEWKKYSLSPERVNFMSEDGIRLVGALIPGTNGATIVLLHGFGRSKEQLLPQASALNKAGFSIFMFDFRGSGESTGKYITFGGREHLDLAAAVQFLKKRSDVDMSRFGILGFSMGGVVALLKAHDIPEIKAMVINSTFARFKNVIASNMKDYFKGVPFFPVGWLVVLIIRLRTGIWFTDINPIIKLEALKKVPLMFIHGVHDKKVPVEDALEYRRLGPWLEEFWVIKNADHDDLYDVSKNEYDPKVISFFRKHLLST
ncbi:MAG: alpha/beta fold hydrolase [Patescibacteria group bacterium]